MALVLHINNSWRCTMVTMLKRMGSFFFLAFAAMVLSGCMAAPLLLGADLAQHYTLKTTLTGQEIANMSNWNDRYNKELKFVLPGMQKGTWTCASRSGTEICVPAEQAVRSNITSRARFECYNGRGGIFTNLATNEFSTLYCKKVIA